MNRQLGYFILAVLFSALSLGSAPAFSQDQGFYAGASFGKSDLKDACTGLPNCDDSDTTLGIFGGYQFNRHFGAEIGYTDLGKASASSGAASATLEAKGLEFLAVGTIPLNQQFSLYGKLGLFMWDADIRVSGPATVLTSDDGTDLTIGFGARYSFTKNLAAQLQWQRYDLDNFDVDVISVGILFRF